MNLKQLAYEALKESGFGKNSKAYAYEVSKIEVVPGTLGGKANPTTNPTGTTHEVLSGTLGGRANPATNPSDKSSISANIILQGAVGVNGDPFI